MSSLLISKIENIEIDQIGATSITITNKKVDGSKVVPIEGGTGSKKTITKSIDIGKGDVSFSVSFYSKKRTDDSKIEEILQKGRVCNFTDKYRGTFKVYIDKIGITNTPEHQDLTKYKISFTVQDEVPPDFVDTKISLTDEINNMTRHMQGLVNKVANKVSSLKQKGLGFVDSGLNFIRQGVVGLMTISSTVQNIAGDVDNRLNQIEQLTYSITQLKNEPGKILEAFKSISDRFAKNEKFVKVDVLKPMAQGKLLEDLDIANVAGQELKELERASDLENVVNMQGLLCNVKLFLSDNLKLVDDFEKTYEQVSELINYCGYDDAEKVKLKRKIDNYYNANVLNNTKEIKVIPHSYLVDVLYEEKSSLENYDQIAKLNNFNINFDLDGKVKVFV